MPPSNLQRHKRPTANKRPMSFDYQRHTTRKTQKDFLHDEIKIVNDKIIESNLTKYKCCVCLNDKPTTQLVKCAKCVCITCLDCNNIILGDFYEYYQPSMNAPKCPLCRRVIVPNLNIYADNATIDEIEPTGIKQLHKNPLKAVSYTHLTLPTKRIV